MLSLCTRCGAAASDAAGERCGACAPSTLETTVALATATSPTGKPTKRSLARAARATREDGVDWEWGRALRLAAREDARIAARRRARRAS